MSAGILDAQRAQTLDVHDRAYHFSIASDSRDLGLVPPRSSMGPPPTGNHPWNGTAGAREKRAAGEVHRSAGGQSGDPLGSCWGDHLPCMIGPNYCAKPSVRVPPLLPPVMQATRWHCLEVMHDGGTPTPTQTGASGEQDFWIDDVEYGPWTGLWHRTTATAMNVNLLSVSSFYHNVHADVGVRYDNVVVGTSRIGCVAPSTALSSPKNLRIIR